MTPTSAATGATVTSQDREETEDDMPVFSASNSAPQQGGESGITLPQPPSHELSSLVQQVEQLLTAAATSSSSSSSENQLDASLVQEYRYAADVCPGLVAAETRVEDFLRTVDYQVVAAAERLARYWKMRKLLFSSGRDDNNRWLYPMRQTGNGCLNPEQIRILRSGFIKVAADSSTHGPVWIVDFSLLPSDVQQSHQPWTTFYMGTVCTCAASQSPGITLLVVVKSGQQRPPVHWSPPSVTSMLVVPLRIQRFLVVQVQQPGWEHLLDFLGYHDSRVIGESVRRPPRTQSVVASSSAASSSALGIPVTHLPACLGGSVDDLNFKNWIRMRVTIEDVLGGSPRVRNLSRVPSPATVAGPTTTHLVKRKSTNKVTNVEQADGESLAEFHKRRQAAYARRSYHRRKVVDTAWQAAAEQQKVLRAKLVAEGKRLEGLLAQAVVLVGAVTEGRPQSGSAVARKVPSRTYSMPQIRETSNNTEATYKTELESFGEFLGDVDL